MKLNLLSPFNRKFGFEGESYRKENQEKYRA